MSRRAEPLLDLPTVFTDEQIDELARILARWLIKLAKAEVANDAEAVEPAEPMAKRHAA